VLFNVGVIYFSKVFFLTFIYASEAKAFLVSYKKTRYVAHTVKSSENLVIKTNKKNHSHFMWIIHCHLRNIYLVTIISYMFRYIDDLPSLNMYTKRTPLK